MGAGDHTGHRDRLRNKYIQHGIESLEQHEVLELLLFYAIPRRNTNDIAHDLLNKYGTLSNLMEAPIQSLIDNGLTKRSATFIKLLPDLCRVYYDNRYETKNETITQENIVEVMRKKFLGRNDEYFIVLLLDSQKREKYCCVASQGNHGAVEINFQKIIALALQHNAVEVIIAHNHPSGNPFPSREDIDVTRRLYDALQLVKVTLKDHVVVTDQGCFSFTNSGMMADILQANFKPQ